MYELKEGALERGNNWAWEAGMGGGGGGGDIWGLFEPPPPICSIETLECFSNNTDEIPVSYMKRGLEMGVGTYLSPLPLYVVFLHNHIETWECFWNYIDTIPLSYI